MADLQTMARPYAKAVFELARDESRLADWSTLLSGVSRAVGDPAVAGAIGHPAIGRGQLGDAMIEGLGKGATEQAKNLVRLLSENRRLVLVPAIAAQYEAMRAEHESRMDVEIVTAAPVDEAQQVQLLDAVCKKLKRDVKVLWKVDPKLIAGAEIRAGDTVIDGSISGELERLRQALTA